MQYLLDTCVLSDFARGESSTVTYLKEIPPSDLAISTVTEMEIAYGLRLNPSYARRLRPIMDALLSAMVAFPTIAPPRGQPANCAPSSNAKAARSERTTP
jgi:tRNA(fMet)-specific endonuclease VapC